MDYDKMADELLTLAAKYRANDLNRHINDAIHGEHMIMGLVYHSEGIAPGELAVKMNASTAYIAKLLRNMEEKGLLIRTTDPSDRRRTLITLTEKGREKSKHDISFIHNRVKDMLEYLGEEDAENFIRILRKFSKLDCEQH